MKLRIIVFLLFTFKNANSYMPYQEFKKKFQLGNTSTEKLHPATMKLSQTMHKDIVKGLEILLDAEKEVIEGFEQNIENIATSLVPSFKNSLNNEGRIFLIGSGSSGRLAIDLAAKVNSYFPNFVNRVQGIIAGGDAAIVRAKEGFEDSENDGINAISKFDVNKNDTIVLISGSGSASFNVGCGNMTADLGAKVFYFYNSSEIPERTANLFMRKNNPVIPLLLDIGPQAISGSTRLQSATIAIICLGFCLYVALSSDNESHYRSILLNGFDEAMSKILLQFNQIKKIIEAEVKIFSDPNANFRQLKDFSNQGYVTMLATVNSIREAFIDTTETSPTFSTNPLRKETEIKRKRPEFQAYLIESSDNKIAWRNLLGRSTRQDDENEAMQFLLSYKAPGNNSYLNRPKFAGNIVLGVSKLNENENINQDLIRSLINAKLDGATTIMLIVSGYKLSDEQKKIIYDHSDFSVLIDDIKNDPFGIIHTFTLKIILNLISNGSMILMNKVYGNRMIDLNPSNNKLVDRSIRIIKDIGYGAFLDKILEDEMLYDYIQQLYEKKKIKQENGFYVPSIINIMLNLLYRDKKPEDFEELSKTIRDNHESLNFLDINWS